MTSSVVNVKSTVRIISTIKGKPLTEAEVFFINVNLMPGVNYPDTVKKTVCETEVRHQFAEVFVGRLKKNAILKNSIGGTKWSVDLLTMEYDGKE
jgi:hypothetical protein